MAVDINDRLYRVFAIGWLLDRHPPRLPFRIHPPARQRAAHRDQVARDPLLLHQARQMIGGVAFTHGREIDKQIRNIFLQKLLAGLVDHRQML